jgi:predicted metal-dependent hydrolase
MNTKFTLTIGETDFFVKVKEVDNLHVSVHPPDGEVRVSAPKHMSEEDIKLALLGKIEWIQKQQKKFGCYTRQPEKKGLYRESLYFLGKRYLLDIEESTSKPKVVIKNKTKLLLLVDKNFDTKQRVKVIDEWHRSELKTVIEPLVVKWQGAIGEEVSFWGVRKMKTKWGTCNAKEKRIWFNLELAEKPIPAIEYVIVHEILHLKQGKHGEEFTELLDCFLPDWRQRKNALLSQPLAHRKWRNQR